MRICLFVDLPSATYSYAMFNAEHENLLGLLPGLTLPVMIPTSSKFTRLCLDIFVFPLKGLVVVAAVVLPI